LLLHTNKLKIPFEIDDEDYESVSRYFWHISTHGYPTTHIKEYYNGFHIGNPLISLHQFLMGRAPEGLEWDHKDRNRLNNTRDNFRLVTRERNNRNRKSISSNTGHIGIHALSNDKFAVYVYAFDKSFYFGRFNNLEEAINKQKMEEEKLIGYRR